MDIRCGRRVGGKLRLTPDLPPLCHDLRSRGAKPIALSGSLDAATRFADGPGILSRIWAWPARRSSTTSRAVYRMLVGCGAENAVK